MKTPLAVHRWFKFALVASVAGVVTGCGTFQPDRPPLVIVQKGDAVQADGKEWKKCKAPKDVGTLPDCRLLRGGTVEQIKSVTILRGTANPTCEVYYWEGYYWEYCW